MFHIFPPEPSRRLIVDTVAWTARHAPKWNPINVCSYHLQEAGATPTQELAYALATAIGVLDAVRDSGQVTVQALPDVVGRIIAQKVSEAVAAKRSATSKQTQK